MRWFSTLPLLLALALVACVPKAPRRANSAEARAGAPQSGAEQASVESMLKPPAGKTRPPEVNPGQLRNSGYWHWDGVRYVRVSGTVEAVCPPYTWGCGPSQTERQR